MKPSKPILIAGGIALAVGAIWYIKKSEKPAEEFYPAQTGGNAAPTTYYSGQEAAGSFFNPGGGMGGGGAPTTQAPGVTTTQPPNSCGIGTQKQNGICVPSGAGVCPEGKTAVGISAIAGKPGGIRCE